MNYKYLLRSVSAKNHLNWKYLLLTHSIKISLKFVIVAYCLQHCCWGQSTTVRPYKFGFNIDQQQHRREMRGKWTFQSSKSSFALWREMCVYRQLLTFLFVCPKPGTETNCARKFFRNITLFARKNWIEIWPTSPHSCEFGTTRFNFNKFSFISMRFSSLWSDSSRNHSAQIFIYNKLIHGIAIKEFFK